MNGTIRHSIGMAGIMAALIAIGVFSDGGRAFSQSADVTPPAIGKVKIVETTPTSTVVTWETDEETESTLNYSTDKNYCTLKSSVAGRSHRFMLDDLDPSTAYFFRAVSVDKDGNQGISGDFLFNTEALKEVKDIGKLSSLIEKNSVEKIAAALEKLKSADALGLVEGELKKREDGALKAPIIIGRPEMEIGTDYVQMNWGTDVEADSMVGVSNETEFANGGSYGIYQGQPDELVTDHTVRVIGLRPSTAYHLQIVSKPQSGPESRSRDIAITTKSLAPTIENVQMEKIEETAATIGWRTNFPTAGSVEYINMKTSEKKSSGDPTMLTSHSVRLNGLIFNTTYEAIVVAENEAGEKIKSKPIQFKTIKDDQPPVIAKIKNESTLFPSEDLKVQTIISWETDELAVCQLFYRQGGGDAGDSLELPKEAVATVDHVQVVTAFSAATVYKFWVKCVDRSDNEQQSENFVLFTPSREKSIIDVIIENFSSTFGWVKKIGV